MSKGLVLLSLALLSACRSSSPKEEPPAPMPAAHASEAASSTASSTKDPASLSEGATAAHPTTAAKEEEKKEKVPDRFMLRGGGFAMSHIGTSASLSPLNLPIAASVDFNKTLGLNSSNFSGRVDSIFRFNDSSAIGFSWFSFNLSGTKVIDRQIDFGGMTYPINAQVDSFLDQDIYKLNYRYSIYHNDDIEFGASAGFDIQHFHVGLSAPGIMQTSSEAATAPLPVFGAFVNYHFMPRLLMGIEYEFFFLELDNASGSLQDLLVSLEYRFFDNVALGAAFNFYQLDADYTSSTSKFSLQQNWNGLMAYISIYL